MTNIYHIESMAENLIREHNKTARLMGEETAVNVILWTDYLDGEQTWATDYDSQLTPAQAQILVGEMVEDCKEGYSPNMVTIHLAAEVDAMPYADTALCVYINDNHPYNKI